MFKGEEKKRHQRILSLDSMQREEKKEENKLLYEEQEHNQIRITDSMRFLEPDTIGVLKENQVESKDYQTEEDKNFFTNVNKVSSLKKLETPSKTNEADLDTKRGSESKGITILFLITFPILIAIAIWLMI